MSNIQTIQLRPEQNKAINWFLNNNSQHCIIQEATGMGKTEIAIEIIKKHIENGKKCLFLTHTKELRDQSFNRITKAGVDCGLIASEKKYQKGKPCYVVMLPTLSARVKGIEEEKITENYRENYFTIQDWDTNEFDLVIFDECHHIDSGQWSYVYRILQAWFSSAKFLGLSATPIGTNGKGLGKYFDKMHCGLQVYEAIEKGYLCDFEYYSSITTIDYNALGIDVSHNEKKDLSSKELRGVEMEFDRMNIYGDVIKEWQEKALNKKTLIYCVTISHANKVRDAFQKVGYNFAVVHSELAKQERDDIIKAYISGGITGLINVKIFVEGNDVPDIECIMLLSATRSLRLFKQEIGRGLRVKPNGEKLKIIDFGRNWEIHGLPDEHIDWTLMDFTKKDRKKAESQGKSMHWNCPSCYIVNLKNSYKCWKCGCENNDRVPFETEQELKQIERKKQEEKQNQEQFLANQIQDILALPKAVSIRQKKEQVIDFDTACKKANEMIMNEVKNQMPEIYNKIELSRVWYTTELYNLLTEAICNGENMKALEWAKILTKKELHNFLYHLEQRGVHYNDNYYGMVHIFFQIKQLFRKEK